MESQRYGRLERDIEKIIPGTFIQVAADGAMNFALASQKRGGFADDAPPLLILSLDPRPYLSSGDVFSGRAYAFDDAVVVPDPTSAVVFPSIQKAPDGALLDDGGESYGVCGALGPSATAELALFRLDGTFERLPTPNRIVLFTRWSVVIPWREAKDRVVFTMALPE